MRNFISEFHDDLMKAMMPYQNQTLETSRIRRIIDNVQAFQGREQWIYPSDHCINHTNEGACYCAETERAIFKRVRRGLYSVRSKV
jgi:hypothetical protein